MKRTRENGESQPLPSVINAMSVAVRVAALRKLMAQHAIDAFLVPTEDAHMSEYVTTCDKRRDFITGFTGSAGTALVTMDAAYCWTDGRYFVQALEELDPNVYKMMKTHEDPPPEEWAPANLPRGTKLYVDGKTVSVGHMKRFKSAIAAAGTRRITLSTLPSNVQNLVDTVWSSARPTSPASTIYLHPVKYAGVSATTKLTNMRAKMVEKKVTMLVVAGLDEVAWLLNLRGADIDFNPVFWAYVTISKDAANMYVNSTRFGEGVAEHLKTNNISVHPYESLFEQLANKCWEDKSCVWLDPGVCNYSILEAIERSSASVRLIKKQGPIPLAKAKKCSVELDGMRACHIRDGVALAKYLCWLENEVVKLGHTPTECEAATRLEKFRSEQDLFAGLSFPTISSAGSNGAVVHYAPEPATAAKITSDVVYLVDSGGQYRDGTTDVTRTMHFGTPTKWQKKCFTRVLQGHMALDTAIFPKGTTGHLLDGFARHPLWKDGLDYKHGTGHGVGSFLNVHEGPHVISFRSQALGTAMEPGFITSNEPGYYEENSFGIRIESLCVVVDKDVQGPPNGTEKPFYGMEHVTFSPIQAKMIDTSLLSQWEREWVDSYHKECFEKLSPLLKDDEVTLAWLKRNTEPLEV